MTSAAELRRHTLDLVLELSLLVDADMKSGLARDGLTPARAHLLFHVVQHGPTTQQRLAEALEVSPRNVTGLVDGLAATGFVTREQHPRDRRATLVTLTDHGQQVAARLVTGRHDYADQLLGGLAPEALGALADGLGEVVGRMRELVAVGGGAP